MKQTDFPPACATDLEQHFEKVAKGCPHTSRSRIYQAWRNAGSYDGTYPELIITIIDDEWAHITNTVDRETCVCQSWAEVLSYAKRCARP